MVQIYMYNLVLWERRLLKIVYWLTGGKNLTVDYQNQLNIF